MQQSSRIRSRISRVGVLALVVVLATAAAALAANPVKGAKYSGMINANGGLAISFKVSSTGKNVVKMSVPQPPIFCQGGGPPPPQDRAKPAPISSTGTFKETLQYVSSTGSVIATLKVTGAFHAHRKESGKVTVSWSSTSCNGSALYSTKAA
jgi:hypothetical protein